MWLLEFLSSIGIGALLGTYLSHRYSLRTVEDERDWNDSRDKETRDHAQREARTGEWRALQLKRLEGIYRDFDLFLSTVMALRKSYKDASVFGSNFMIDKLWRERENTDALHRELFESLHRIKIGVVFLDDATFRSKAQVVIDVAEEFAAGGVKLEDDEWRELLGKYAAQYYELKRLALPTQNRIIYGS